jgi:hypothetical protein
MLHIVKSSSNGNGGNSHHRRVRHQIHHGRRRAALKADTAVTLVEGGMPVAEAIERCGTTTNYYAAMKAVRESEDPGLHQAVLEGYESLFAAAKRVKNAAAAIKAYRKCSLFEQGMVWLATGATTDLERLLRSSTPEQLVEVSRRIGSDWIWDWMIAPAMAPEPATEVITEPATVVKAKLNENGTVVPLL